MKKILDKLCLFFGLILAVAGLVIGLVTNQWSLLPLGLLIAGTILIAVWLVLTIQANRGFWHKRGMQVGTNAFIATTAILLIIGLINFIAIRNSFRFDLTENKIFTLSPQTQAIVQNLSQPLKVWIFDRNVDPEIESLLQNYRRYSQNFQFEVVDPEINLQLAKGKFKVQSPGEIHLEYGNKKQRIQTLDPSSGNNLTEVQLTNAIEKIQRDRALTLYFIQGHGEAQLKDIEGGLSQAVQSLENRGYQVQPLTLATSGKIPENTNVIAIAGATRKLFPAEVKIIQEYLNNGGNLLLMLPPETDPGLTLILNDWGIQLDNRLAIDASGAGNVLGLGPAAPIINNYGEHPITKDFAQGITIFPESRPLKIVPKEGITATPLVITNEQSWAESDLSNQQLQFDASIDIKGPLDLAFALTRKENPQAKESRLVIFGSNTFATNGWLQQQLNSDLLLNSINWLAREDEQTLSISAKEQTNRRINLAPLQAKIISLMALFIMPMIALGLAIFTWWRRR
ncbi:MAG: Gldg family protein [Stanieria sp.]